MLGEIVSGAESGDTSNDRILAVLRVGHIARYAPSLAPCYTPIMRRHSANLTVQRVLRMIAGYFYRNSFFEAFRGWKLPPAWRGERAAAD